MCFGIHIMENKMKCLEKLEMTVKYSSAFGFLLQKKNENTNLNDIGTPMFIDTFFVIGKIWK